MKKFFYLMALLGFSLPVFSQTNIPIYAAWNPNTNPIVAGVNIYYGQQSQVYTNKVSAPQPSNSVAIPNILAGHTYYFVATTYSLAAAESSYSSPEVVFFATNKPVVVYLPPPTNVSIQYP